MLPDEVIEATSPGTSKEWTSWMDCLLQRLMRKSDPPVAKRVGETGERQFMNSWWARVRVAWMI